VRWRKVRWRKVRRRVERVTDAGPPLDVRYRKWRARRVSGDETAIPDDDRVMHRNGAAMEHDRAVPNHDRPSHDRSHVPNPIKRVYGANRGRIPVAVAVRREAICGLRSGERR